MPGLSPCTFRWLWATPGISAKRKATSVGFRFLGLGTRYSHGAMSALNASIAQLAERALRKRTVVGSIPTGGSLRRTASP